MCIGSTFEFEIPLTYNDDLFHLDDDKLLHCCAIQ